MTSAGAPPIKHWDKTPTVLPKTTVVKAVSGVNPIKHKIEKERNITYNLGYANAKLFKCAKCPSPEAYKSYGSEKDDHAKCDNLGCDGNLELQRHISFVDCPGHDILMATMLNGAAVMDAALLLVGNTIFLNLSLPNH